LRGERTERKEISPLADFSEGPGCRVGKRTKAKGGYRNKICEDQLNPHHQRAIIASSRVFLVFKQVNPLLFFINQLRFAYSCK